MTKGMFRPIASERVLEAVEKTLGADSQRAARKDVTAGNTS